MSNTSALKLPTKKQRELLNRATERYAKGVLPAVTFLENKYGISKEIAQHWQLGLVEEPLPGHEDYRGRLSIPYLTPAGTVAMKFRCIQCVSCLGHKKYLAEAGSGDYLFGVGQLATESHVFAICEGELDTIVCSDIVGTPAVGVPGATKWRAYWSRLFEGFEEVVLLRDGDEAGRTLADVVVRSVYNARVVGMPTGEDVASFCLKWGPQALRERAEL